MRPPADVSGTFARLLPGAAARPVWVVLGGVAGLGLVLAVMSAPDPPARRPAKVRVEAVTRRPATASPVVTPADRTPLADDARDSAAVTYYRVRDRASAAHVREIIWTPPILRVYTDLSGSAANSRAAIALCETAAAYLEGRGRSPVVFVHARERDGYPVLANKMDADDGCRLGRVP